MQLRLHILFALPLCGEHVPGVAVLKSVPELVPTGTLRLVQSKEA